jgi:adenylate cyclase
VAIASRGYGAGGIGAEVAIGDGIIGIGGRAQAHDPRRGASAPSCATAARSASASSNAASTPGSRRRSRCPDSPTRRRSSRCPMLAGDGWSACSRSRAATRCAFDEWDEAFLQIVANQIAMGIDRMQEDDEERAPRSPANAAPERAPERVRKLRFVFYRNDDCVFVDGEYLVRNVPGKILWKLLKQHQRDRGHASSPTASSASTPRSACRLSRTTSRAA